MLYISIKTTKVLTLSQELDLKKITGKLISILSDGSESHLMVHIEDNQLIYFKGQEIDCMIIECKIWGHPDKKSKQSFISSLMYRIEEITKIPAANQYITFEEKDDWGTNGELI